MIYDNICNRAKQKGISINQIEKDTGLAIGSVCKWNIVSPTIRNLKKVADYLHCTVDELLAESTQQILEQTATNIPK